MIRSLAVKSVSRCVCSLLILLTCFNGVLRAANDVYKFNGIALLGNWDLGPWTHQSGAAPSAVPNGADHTAIFGDLLGLVGPLLTVKVNGTDGKQVQNVLFNSAALVGDYGYIVGSNATVFLLQNPETLTISAGGSITNTSVDKQRMAGNITAAGNISVVNNTPLGSSRELVFQADAAVADFLIPGGSTGIFQGTNNIYINHGIAGAGVTRLTGGGNLLVDMNGTAALVLSQSTNNYTGTSTIRKGQLILNGTDANLLGTSNTPIQLGDGSTATGDTIILTYGSPSTYTRDVNVNNNNPTGTTTIQASTTTPNAVTAVSDNTVALAGSVRLATPANTTLRFQNDSVLTGAGGVKIVGPGTIEFRGTNTYTGNTDVNGGTLSLNNAAGTSIAAGNLSIDTGTTVRLNQANQLAPGVGVVLNGGTFNLNSHNASSGTVGPLTLSENSILDMGGTGPANIRFSELDAFDTSKVWTIANWSTVPATHVEFTDYSNLTPDVLAKINFTGYGLGAQLIINGGIGEVVPVPEPATVVSGIFGFVSVLMAGIIKRRRRA